MLRKILFLAMFVFLFACDGSLKAAQMQINDTFNQTSMNFNLTESEEPNQTIERDIYACNQDSDCISVVDGCCNCGHMGKNAAINKAYSDYWQENCSGIACLASMSHHWTCFTEPKCVQGKCQLIKIDK